MRALSELEREERRSYLAEQGLAVLEQMGWQKLTMAAIARRAGVSKGALFMFFDSKEDLFIHGLQSRFHEWFARLEAIDPSAGTAADWSAATLASLRADPLLLPLLALSGPVLEQGASPAAVLRLKESLAAGLRGLAAVWSSRLPEVEPARWAPLFMRVYAAIVGAWSVGEPATAARSAIENRPDLSLFGLGFDALFLPMMEAELEALTKK